MQGRNESKDLNGELVARAIFFLGVHSQHCDCDRYPELSTHWGKRAENKRHIGKILYETVKAFIHFTKQRNKIMLSDVLNGGWCNLSIREIPHDFRPARRILGNILLYGDKNGCRKCTRTYAN